MVFDAVWQLDRQDHVIECAEVSLHVRRNRPTPRIYGDIVGIDASLAHHRSHQCGLVLTVSVTMGKDLAGGMWLPASDAEFYCHVPDVALYETGKSADLI